MTEAASITSVPLTIENFSLDEAFLAEVQKGLCKDFDEASKNPENSHSTEVWSAVMAFLESGLDKRAGAQEIHKEQREKLVGSCLNPNLMQNVLHQFDGASRSKKVPELISALCLFFAANLGNTKEADDFASKINNVEGTLNAFGYKTTS